MLMLLWFIVWTLSVLPIDPFPTPVLLDGLGCQDMWREDKYMCPLHGAGLLLGDRHDNTSPPIKLEESLHNRQQRRVD